MVSCTELHVLAVGVTIGGKPLFLCVCFLSALTRNSGSRNWLKKTSGCNSKEEGQPKEEKRK